MAEFYNIYCDESCHLENDGIKPMVLGAVWCPKDKSKEIHARIREIKKKYIRSDSNYELKWIKISPSLKNLYLDVIDYFFDDDDLHFRGVIVKDKRELNHKDFHQTHDEFYYKMVFLMLKTILDPSHKHNIYLDYKDSNGAKRVRKLHEVITNDRDDFDHRIVNQIALVKSHHVESIQITDIIIGALGYYYRGLTDNSAKVEIINRIKARSGYSLDSNTLYKEEKFNLLVWNSQGPRYV